MASLRDTEFGSLQGVTYLNRASTGPLPERTIRALERFNRMRGAPHLLPDPDLFAIFAESRRLIAQLLNATPDEIALAMQHQLPVRALGNLVHAYPTYPDAIRQASLGFDKARFTGSVKALAGWLARR